MDGATADWDPDAKPGSLAVVVVADGGVGGTGGSCVWYVWKPDAKPGPRDGGCEGVLCGSGSLSDEEDEELDEDEAELGVVRLGGRSPSGSSRARTVCPRSQTWPWAGCLSGVSGGGPSTCMWVAVRSSVAVGMAPRSTYREPAILCGDHRPASDSIS